MSPKRRVLVIGDPALTSQVRFSSAFRGIELTLIVGGEGGLCEIQTRECELVILDLDASGESATTILAAARQRDIAVIAISERWTPDLIASADALGAVLFEKPLELYVLETIAEHLLGAACGAVGLVPTA